MGEATGTPRATLEGVDDEALQAWVADAVVTPLLVALAFVLQDESLLDPTLGPDALTISDATRGLTPDQVVRSREAALAALIRLRDGSHATPSAVSDRFLTEALSWAVGGRDLTEYPQLLREELALQGTDERQPDWALADIAPDRKMRAVIVGAGMSGIVAAHRLGQAGIDVTILEAADGIGGTWLKNTYPGCRVDVPNHLYCYSFAQRHDWPGYFSTRDILLDYFAQCAAELGLVEHIRFGAEVTTAAWDEDRSVWVVSVDQGDVADGETVEAEMFISAVGQLNRPNMPDIDGIDSFDGPSFHSAEWRHDVDLAGKRVGVIGTGASAAQFVPIIATEAAELTVYQRTPNWMAPTPEYRDPVITGMAELFTRMPTFSEFYRLWLFIVGVEGLLPAVEVDPNYTGPPSAVSDLNAMVAMLLTENLTSQLPEGSELASVVVPQYPPAAKRVLRDDGSWLTTLQRDDVELVTTPISGITPAGVTDADGTERAHDVLIYGTGFEASKFLTPMRVTGIGGADLHEQWNGDARAYVGITIPNFPNFFCMYGPNTNIVVNGSIIYFSECETNYIVACAELLARGGHASMDVRTDVHDEFNVAVDEANKRMAWGHAEVNSWYKSESGRVAQNWPFSLLEYWQRTQAPNPDDYVVS